MKKELKEKEYILEIIKKYPNIKSGRKNYRNHEIRIEKTIKLIMKYKKNLKNY